MASFRDPKLENGDELSKKIASTILSFVFSPFRLLRRLAGDEVKLRNLNRLLLDSQRQGPTTERKLLIVTTFVLIVVQLSTIYLLATGSYTRGDRSPIELVKIMYTYGRLPVIEEVFNQNISIIFATSILVSNLLYLATFSFKGSRYKRFMNAIKDAGLTNSDSHTDRIWYYPKRLALLPLVGRTGEDLIKNKPLWNQARFNPSADFRELPGNVFLFVAKVEKPSESTFLYERYQEWTSLMTDPLKAMNWQLGEYVEKNAYKWKDMRNNSTLAFIGTTGSGKTEAMRVSFAAAKIMHPEMRFLIHDPKAAGDWDIFAPFTESGRIIKTQEEAEMMFFYAKAVVAARRAYCQEKGYSNINQWMQREGVTVPILMLIVDEFPNFNKLINFDFNFKKPDKAAGILFELFTMGRSYGVWFTLGTQFGLGEHVPNEVNKNIKAHICLRVGSPGESAAWINTDDAFRLGKGKTLENGEEDPQSGYAYIDDNKEFVRFWYADNTLLYHEFLKYKSPVIKGTSLVAYKTLSMPAKLAEKLDALKKIGKGLESLPTFEKRIYKTYQKAKTHFESSIEKMSTSPAVGDAQILEPLCAQWMPGEDGPTYAERAYKEAIQRLGVPHRYVPLFGGINTSSKTSPNQVVLNSKAPGLNNDLDAKVSSVLPSRSYQSSGQGLSSESEKSTRIKKTSVADEPEIKRPSLSDIFDSLSSSASKDKRK
jgi:hypothetical protein